MWLIFVEAGFALCLLVFIVWWTMFAGQRPQQTSLKKNLPTKDIEADGEQE
jgi:hypothetical protein